MRNDREGQEGQDKRQLQQRRPSEERAKQVVLMQQLQHRRPQVVRMQCKRGDSEEAEGVHVAVVLPSTTLLPVRRGQGGRTRMALNPPKQNIGCEARLPAKSDLALLGAIRPLIEALRGKFRGSAG